MFDSVVYLLPLNEGHTVMVNPTKGLFLCTSAGSSAKWSARFPGAGVN